MDSAQAGVALRFCDETKVFEFLPLCLLIVSAVRPTYHGGKAYELTC